MKNSDPAASAPAMIMVCILVLCSALYIKYRGQTDTVAVMSSFPDYVSEYSNNMSLSDFGESVYKCMNS